MPTYSITVTDEEDKALRTVFLDPQEWFAGFVRSRIVSAADEVVQAEIKRRLDANMTIPGGRTEIIRQADVKTIEQIRAEKEAQALARGPQT